MTELRRQQFIRNTSFRFLKQTIFSSEQCQQILNNLKPEYSLRHSAYKTNSQSFKDKGVIEILEQILFKSVPGFEKSDLFFLDLFIVKYDSSYPSLGPHTDGCLLSLTLQLNHELQFEGGGLQFTKSDEIFHLKQGELLLFRSKIEHQGLAIQSGQRIILVGFIETKRRGILSKEYFLNQERNTNAPIHLANATK